MAAPADVPRKYISGGPRVTVRPNYVGLPLIGLVGTGGSEAKASAILRWQVHPSGPESTVPGSEIAAVERRKATRSPD